MALYGIDRLPVNLERVEIADMDVNLQTQWFFKWYQLFPGDDTLDFQKFIQEKNRCPRQLKELAKEPLLLYMLVAMNRDGKLNVSQIQQSRHDTQAKISVYEQALEWVLEKQRHDKRHGNLTEELTQLDPDALKRLLAEAAMAVVQSGGECADIQTIRARLQQDDEVREILEQAQRKLGKDEALKNTLAAFYIKSNHSGGVEFFHKSFREFLCASRIKQSLEDWTEERFKRGKSFYIVEEKQFYEQIYDLFGYGGLTAEIVEYIFGLLDKSDEFKPTNLFHRLNDFYHRWCDGEFIDSIEETLPLNTARKFQKNGIKLSQRAVDIYAGLNVMILLLGLHRKLHVRILPVNKPSANNRLKKYIIDDYAIKNLKFELENNITFYPSGKPEEDKFTTQLLRVINYSNYSELRTFKTTVSYFLSGADLSRANLCLAYLGQANLSHANLSNTYFSGADLSRADLSYANLSHADLSHANLSQANLSHANFSRTDLRRVDLFSASLHHTDLSGANLSGANLSSAKLSSADLSGADLYGADLYSANLSGANLSDANLSRVNLTRVNLSRANLSGADLRDTKNLTPKQVKAAFAWSAAKYDPDFRQLLW